MMRTFFLTFSILLIGCGDKETDATTVVPDNSAKLQASLEESLAEIVALKHANAKLAADFDSATNTISSLHKRIDLMNAERQAPPPNANNPEVAQLKAVIEQQKNFILQLRQAQGAKPKPAAAAAAAAAGGASKLFSRASFDLWIKNKSKAEVIRWKKPDSTQGKVTLNNVTTERWYYENTTYDSLTRRIDFETTIVFHDGVVKQIHYFPGPNKVP